MRPTQSGRILVAALAAALAAIGPGCLLDKTGYIEDEPADAGSGGHGGGSSAGEGGAEPGPTCNDGAKNQDESDVDCGGPCKPCRFGQTCHVDADCYVRCDAGRCAADAFGAWRIDAPAASPPSRAHSTMVFDAKRGRAVLFGGFGAASNALGDTWEWDGTTWAPGPAGPPARWVASMAFDAARGVTVLYGGYPPDATETWEYDGAAWKPKAVAPATGGRWSAAVAYDADRKRVVLFGGTNGPTTFDETWEYDGSAWTLASPAHRPAARVNARMVFDAARGETILFGGEIPVAPQQTKRLADTWAWDGVDWTERKPATSPPPRSYHAMTYDPARARVIVYGGANELGLLADTWEWDGTAWHPEVAGPLAVLSNWMVFDAPHHRAVMFAGFSGSFITQTWEYYALATPCTKATDCGGGLCEDGLCCASTCGTCAACAEPSSPGLCAPVTARDDPDTCTGASTCDATGACVAR